MIITNILGGLGNQLFQFSTGTATAIALDLPSYFAVDSFESYGLHHGLQLEDAFDLKLNRASSAQIRSSLGILRSPSKVRRLLTRLPHLHGSRYIAEPSSAWWPDLRGRCGNGAYLHGYWQSERYFEDQKEHLRSILRWRNELENENKVVARQIAAAEHSVSLHVRRGDYLTSINNKSLFATCPPEYYIAALHNLEQMLGTKNLTVFAFSDDPNWVSSVLAPKIPALVTVNHNRNASSWLDMRLMSMCRHHVIANSSFSWWGAWLDGRSDAIVFAPKQWYANGNPDQDLTPDRWHKIGIP